MSEDARCISRLTLRREPGSVAAIARLLREKLDAGDAHRLVWGLFSDAAGGTGRDFLFRDGQHGGAGDGDFLVVSRCPPVDALGLWRIETKAYDPAFSAGQVLGFKLRANPTVSRAGRRHDVVMDRKRALGAARAESDAEIWEKAGGEWLRARAPRLGIELLDCRADGYRRHRLQRREGGTVSFASLDLAGRLRVLEPERLRRAALAGVGHGKAWGCGLLLLRPWR